MWSAKRLGWKMYGCVKKRGFHSKCHASRPCLFSLLFCLCFAMPLHLPLNHSNDHISISTVNPPQSPIGCTSLFLFVAQNPSLSLSWKMAKTLGFSSLLLFLTLLDVPHSRASIPQKRTVSRAQNGVVGTELWCVAKNNAEDAALQASLDWACGPGAADCGPIRQGGSCYDPNDIQATASFAFNDYYLRHGLTDDSCFFDNTAALTSLNPSEYQKVFCIPYIFHSKLLVFALGILQS